MWWSEFRSFCDVVTGFDNPCACADNWPTKLMISEICAVASRASRLCCATNPVGRRELLIRTIRCLNSGWQLNRNSILCCCCFCWCYCKFFHQWNLLTDRSLSTSLPRFQVFFSLFTALLALISNCTDNFQSLSLLFLNAAAAHEWKQPTDISWTNTNQIKAFRFRRTCGFLWSVLIFTFVFSFSPRRKRLFEVMYCTSCVLRRRCLEWPQVNKLYVHLTAV